jgi:pimeloyl-ACP methyl ester carboxylesterase
MSTGKGALSPGTHEISIDGITQRYHVAGNGPVCLVHPGGPGMHWEYLRLPLLEASLKTVYLAPVGTEGSGFVPGGDYGMKRYAHLARAVADRLGVPRPYFMGHSHGGCVGLQLALDFPGEFGGFILYDTGATVGQELYESATAGVTEFALRHAGRPGTDDAVRSWGEEETGDKQLALERVRMMLPLYFADYWHMEPQLESWVSTVDITIDEARKYEPWDVRSELDKITDPTLIIAGEHDFIGGLRWARQMHESINGSRLVTLSRSGHFGHLEEPDAFAQAVRDFIAS